MKQLLLALTLILPLSGGAKEELEIWIPEWEVVKDTMDGTVKSGKTFFTGTLYQSTWDTGGQKTNYLANIEVRIDGKKVAQTNQMGVFRAFVKPGHHSVQFLDPNAPMDKEGKVIYDYTTKEYFFPQYYDSVDFKDRHTLEVKVRMESNLMMDVSDKPVIYLYPEESTNVTVNLDVHGHIAFSYPVYNDGWSYMVDPDGTIHGEDRTYNYLFWEGLHGHALMTSADTREGFIVEGSETVSFLEEVLPQMGLTPQEYNDFIVYWAPRMMDNPYNFIHFSFNEEYEEKIAGMAITPEPDNVFRVFMTYRKVESPWPVEPQVIESVQRNGFTVVEWGGSESKGPAN